MTHKKIAAIIVAGGTGARFGHSIPKQYIEVHNKPLFVHCLEPFMDHPRVDHIQCVIHQETHRYYNNLMSHLPLLPPVFGGKTRQASVLAGLKALQSFEPDYAMIHDAARPNITRKALDELIEAMDQGEEGAILARPITDTVKRVDNGYIVETLPRQILYGAQTPQIFHYRRILDAHLKVAGKNFTDDAAVAEASDMKVKIIIGPANNIKVTTIEDLVYVTKKN